MNKSYTAHFNSESTSTINTITTPTAITTTAVITNTATIISFATATTTTAAANGLYAKSRRTNFIFGN